MKFAKDRLFGLAATVAAVSLSAGTVIADEIVLDPPTPGFAGELNTVWASNCTPLGDVYYFYGLRSGSTIFADCPGVPFEIDNARWLGIGIADEFGDASVRVRVGSRVAGQTVLLQAGEPDTCRISNLVVYEFPGE